MNQKQKNRKLNNQKQWLFFYLILQSREKESEISGTKLYGSLRSTWFHHIYPKSKYPELRYCPDNIIMVTEDEHNEIEHGKTFPELERRKKAIASQYEELVESTKTYELEYLNPVLEHALKNTNFFNKNNKHEKNN